MKKICLVMLFIYVVLSLNAEEKRTIKSIVFEGVKYTNKDFLLSRLGVSVGDTWDVGQKNRILTNLNNLKSIILEVHITEKTTDDNEVILTITIDEKLPFLIVPFFTYSNSGGLKPKLIFRDYNFAGVGKYLGLKVEFLPTEHLGALVEYQDKSFLNVENLSFNFYGTAETSYFNYQLGSIAPLGVIDAEKDDDGKWIWTDENYRKFSLLSNIMYYSSSKGFFTGGSGGVSYKLLDNDDDKDDDDHYRVGLHDFIPSLSYFLNIPIRSGIRVVTSINYSQVVESDELEVEKLKVENSEVVHSYGDFYLSYLPSCYLGVIFQNTANAWTYTTSVSPAVSIYDYKYRLDENFTEFHKKLFKTTTDLTFRNTFEKRFYINPNLTNTFTLNNTVIQRVLEYNDQYQGYDGASYEGYQVWKSVANTVRVYTTFDYTLEYKFYKRNLFKTKFKLFYYYNDVNTDDEYSDSEDYTSTNHKTIADVDKLIYRVNSDYEMGVNTGDIKGYAGGMINISYTIPLFYFTTPSFLNYKMKKPLKWDAFLSLFLDVALAQNYNNDDDTYDEYIISRQKLNLFPGLAGGVRFEIVPQFVPAKMVVELGVDVYKIVKTRSISGNIAFSFGIDNQ